MCINKYGNFGILHPINKLIVFIICRSHSILLGKTKHLLFFFLFSLAFIRMNEIDVNATSHVTWNWRYKYVTNISIYYLNRIEADWGELNNWNLNPDSHIKLKRSLNSRLMTIMTTMTCSCRVHWLSETYEFWIKLRDCLRIYWSKIIIIRM